VGGLELQLEQNTVIFYSDGYYSDTLENPAGWEIRAAFLGATSLALQLGFLFPSYHFCFF